MTPVTSDPQNRPTKTQCVDKGCELHGFRMQASVLRSLPVTPHGLVLKFRRKARGGRNSELRIAFLIGRGCSSKNTENTEYLLAVFSDVVGVSVRHLLLRSRTPLSELLCPGFLLNVTKTMPKKRCYQEFCYGFLPEFKTHEEVMHTKLSTLILRDRGTRLSAKFRNPES